MLDDLMRSVMVELVSRGYALPWMMCVASPNGNVIVARLSAGDEGAGLNCEWVGERCEAADGLMEGPVSIMILDGRARAALCRWVSPDEMAFGEIKFVNDSEATAPASGRGH